MPASPLQVKQCIGAQGDIGLDREAPANGAEPHGLMASAEVLAESHASLAPWQRAVNLDAHALKQPHTPWRVIVGHPHVDVGIIRRWPVRTLQYGAKHLGPGGDDRIVTVGSALYLAPAALGPGWV